MNVLVVGAGEMGVWFARTVTGGLDGGVDLAFADADDEAAAVAAEALDGRVVEAGTEERFDVVCLAVPIPAVASAIETWASNAGEALVDVAGVMGPTVEAMAAAAPDRERVSLHPLFAPANAPGNLAVVADAPGPTTDRVRRALSAAGNDLFETTAAEHDRAMATVQARAHAAVFAFGLAAEDVPDRFHTPVSRALFDVLETVAGNDPRVYTDIQATFDGAGDVATAARELADADAATFERLYREAGRDSPSPEDRPGETASGGRSDR